MATTSTATATASAATGTTPFTVDSPNVQYTPTEITSRYSYESTRVLKDASGNLVVKPESKVYTFKTVRTVPRVGLLLVGWGGNNGTTLTSGVLANRHHLTWDTKTGTQTANYFGSLTQCSTIRLGNTDDGNEVHVPFNTVLPMISPSDLVIGGWDISGMDMASALKRAQVVDIDLQRKLWPLMQDMRPMPSIYYPDFIAANQADRADNVMKGTKQENLEQVRRDIRNFKEVNHLEKVVILWTATTERFSALRPGLNDTAENLLASIKRGEAEISPSTIFATAAILEDVTYINGSPQNTLVPGVIELAHQHHTFVAGDDFKTGQTKMKSVLTEFLVNAGLKLSSIVSYNHLGNNDGRNLSAPQQFRSKEISKSNVVDDMVAANQLLYSPGEHPDHVVVIKYVPYVGDSKRALDEYTSQIFLGGHNTIVLHNTCEDSLLAGPVMLDLVVLAELMTRITYKREGVDTEFHRFDSVLSVLSYLLKAPVVPHGTPVINALSKQRECIVNILRACVGLCPENNMLLEHKAF